MKVVIYPREASERYGVCSEDGFNLYSDSTLSKTDKAAIREILGAAVGLEMASANRHQQAGKLRQYTKSETHKEFHEMTSRGLSEAQTKYDAMIEKYKITKIEKFSGR